MRGLIQNSNNENNLFRFIGPYQIFTSAAQVNPTLGQTVAFTPHTFGNFMINAPLQKTGEDLSNIALQGAVTLLDLDFEAADQAIWEAQFASSPDTLDLLAREGHQEYATGLADEFDPDNDPDML